MTKVIGTAPDGSTLHHIIPERLKNMKTVILKSKEVSGRFLVGESVSLDSSGANPIGLIKEVEQFINLATITIELYDEYRNIDLSQYQELGGLVSYAVIYNFLIQEI